MTYFKLEVSWNKLRSVYVSPTLKKSLLTGGRSRGGGGEVVHKKYSRGKKSKMYFNVRAALQKQRTHKSFFPPSGSVNFDGAFIEATSLMQK